MSDQFAIKTIDTPTYLSAPADGKFGGIPMPQSAVLFGAEGGGIYRFGEINDPTNRDWVEGGLEFYGLKSIARWSTESKGNKYGTLNYVRFFFTAPYQGVTYCLQLSDGTGRTGDTSAPPWHIVTLVQSLLKAKRILEPTGNSIALMPGGIQSKGGDDANVTFLNLFVGPDPFDTNSLTQVVCKGDEKLAQTFDALDAAIDELCEHLGQETPKAAAAEAVAEVVADAIDVDAVNDVAPF